MESETVETAGGSMLLSEILLSQLLSFSVPDSITATSNARYFACAYMIIILALAWILPQSLGYNETLRKWKDIRIWSTVLIVIQVMLYMVF